MSDQESIQSEQDLNETLEIQDNLDTLILEGLEAIEGLDGLRALADLIELPELEEEEIPAENESIIQRPVVVHFLPHTIVLPR